MLIFKMSFIAEINKFANLNGTKYKLGSAYNTFDYMHKNKEIGIKGYTYNILKARPYLQGRLRKTGEEGCLLTLS